MWVTRFEWPDPDPAEAKHTIDVVMADLAASHFNAVLFQVRGNGTAFYRSSIEPFAYEYENGDPGFDPLEVACREAHRRGLALHAWVNVMPAWRGESPPRDSNQLYHAHPEWFLYDQAGKRQPLTDFYVSLNPCLPDVREYLVSVFKEIAGSYPVDGLHLDYIRFPIETAPKGSDYPHDRATLALYKKATGGKPADDQVRWSAWRVQQVTQLVRDIRLMLKRVRPKAKLTVACAPDVDRARQKYFQDGPAWVRGRLVDLAFVMNYSADTRTFRLRHEAWQRAVGARGVAAGIGLYKHDNDRASIDQLNLARQWGNGFALFSNKSLFGPEDPRAPQRLEAIRPILLDMRARAARRAEQAESPVTARVGVTSWVGRESASPRRPAYGTVP